VFIDNNRAIRFYERLGWRRTGATRATAFAPNPKLAAYERTLNTASP
jgi:RimJ/RimL family protein N-acetyltransferase